MKRIVLLLVLVSLALLVLACSNSQMKKEREGVDAQQRHYLDVQPVPFYDYSQIRDTLIQLYSLITPNQVGTYSIITTMTGAYLWECPSIGIPIPADTQLTNPQRVVGNSTIAQAEPTGIFTSANTDGTWVLCVRNGGEVAPVYTEQKVTAFFFPVKIIDGKIVDAGGKATATINKADNR